jgi:hypothetical protein
LYLPVATPGLSPAQVAALRQRAQDAATLGIQLRRTSTGIHFWGVNELRAPRTVAVPLLKLPSAAASGTEQYRVPLVAARIDGARVVRVLLDSGSNQNLFGYSLAQRARIPLIAGMDSMKMHGIGGTVESFPAVVRSLEIDGLELRKLLAAVGPDALALNYPRHVFDSGQVMILGLNALRGLSFLSIDYANGTVTLAPDEEYRPQTAAGFVASTPLRWENDLPVLEATVDGKHKLTCIVDTGGFFGMLVPRVKAEETGYWLSGGKALGRSRGVGGETTAVDYTIKLVTIGNANFLKVPARSNLIGPELGGERTLIGSEILRHHRVTFDFRNSLLWLER